MGRTLIRGAIVIDAPPRQPSTQPTDLLVEDDVIAAVGSNLAVGDAQIVEAAGRIVIPGLVNAHMHTWQTAMRDISIDWNLVEYLRWMHGRVAPHYTPQDVKIGTLAGALNQISCGTTTLGDWCHNVRTPEHVAAAIDGLEEAGIRAVFLKGTPPSPTGVQGAGVQTRAELERLQRERFASRDGLLTLGMAVGGPMYTPFDIAQAELRLAKELDLVISMHHSGGTTPSPDPWIALDAQGLLGPKVNVVHGNFISDELLKRLVDAGVSLTITPEVEMSDGHGHPITGRLRALGAAPSLGVDIEAAISGEMLTTARFALAEQRALDHVAARRGEGPAAPIRAREALAWATIEGARALGLDHRVGSLEPGKQADLVVIDARALNLWPNNDPVATALHASLANIEAVMIAGQWRKRHGQLLFDGLTDLLGALSESAVRISTAAGLTPTAA